LLAVGSAAFDSYSICALVSEAEFGVPFAPQTEANFNPSLCDLRRNLRESLRFAIIPAIGLE